MSIIFQPSGSLDVSTDPSHLPEQSGDGGVSSTALHRSKNLSVDKIGVQETRPGSSNVSAKVLAGTANYIIALAGVRYAFTATEIYQDESVIATGLTAGEWTAVSYNQFNDADQQVFALNGSEQKRINGNEVFLWGIAAPATKPTIAVGAGTGLTGDYNAKYTYIRKVGSTLVSESNPSDAATSAQTLSNEDLKVTWTASSDSQVTHVRIYRTLANGGDYFVDQDVAIGTLTIDTSTAESDLGTIVATNHNRPPAGTLCIGPLFNGYIFIAIGNLLHWCLAKRPEYWDADDFIEVGPPEFTIKALVSLDGQLYAITDRNIHFIQGTTAGAFIPLKFESLTGAPNKYGAAGIKGHGIYHIGADGIYLYRAGVDKKVTQNSLEPLFRGESIAGMQSVTNDASRWLLQYENRLYFHYGNGNALVFNIDNQRTTYYKWDQKIVAPAYDDTNKRLLAGTAGNRVRVMEDRSANSDDGAVIAWESESKEFTLQTRRHFPRWVKYDIFGSTAEGELIIDGTDHQTHSSVGGRVTRRRLIKTENGRRCQIRVTGTGTSGVRMVEME